MPELTEAVADADILVWVVPHQFVKRLCGQLEGHVKPTAHALSLIKVRATRMEDSHLY